MERNPQQKKKKNKTLTPKMRRSLSLVYGIFAFFCVILIGRLAYLSGEDKYEKSALAQQSYVSSVLPYKRGDILDRNGQVLASSSMVYHLILDPKVLLSREENVDPTVKALSAVYGLDEAELRTTLIEKEKSSYVILKKNLTYTEREAFAEYQKSLTEEEASKIKGVWFEEEYQRIYPFQSVASHVIGFTVSGDMGTYGIEQQYNDELTGTNGRTYGYYDASLNIQKTVKEAVDGNQVVSTIDVNVQRVIQKNVEKFLDEVGAENIGVVILDAENGEVLAMHSNYGFDLNAPRDLSHFYTAEEQEQMSSEEKLDVLYDLWRNFCISDAFEPGSTFKPFAVAAALEENVVNYDTEFFCDGKEEFGETIVIRCSNTWGHGKISLVQSLMYSCNDALMQIAELQGREQFFDYQKHFLLGMKTGIDLPGETTGALIAVEDLNQTEIATSSFGQSFTTNMVQMAAGFAALINGGTYYEPHVVMAIKNSDGATLEKIEPVEINRCISKETSNYIREAMYLTVTDGTAGKAQVEGYRIGGKTGTAQKYPREDGKNLVSFLGFVENEERQIVVYVVVDEAHDEEMMSRSATASTLAATIIQESMPYLKIYPEGEIKYYIETVDEEDILTNEVDNPDYNPENNEETTDILTE